MLAAAPLMVAQLGTRELKKVLEDGDQEVFHRLRMGDHMTVAQVLKQLSTAPPLDVLRLCNRKIGSLISTNLNQHAEDLDFTQDVLSTAGNHDELNPTMHAVIAGFNRRRVFGRFKCG